MAEKKEEAEDAKKGGSKKLIIIISVVVILVLLIGGGGFWFLNHKKAKGHGAEVHHQKPIYYTLKTFTVNFNNPTVARFLQVNLDVMTYDAKVVKAIKNDRPAIRNRLIILLSSQQYKEISTLAGKEKLRKQVVKAINDELKKAGCSGKVKRVYFTSFVMQ